MIGLNCARLTLRVSELTLVRLMAGLSCKELISTKQESEGPGASRMRLLCSDTDCDDVFRKLESEASGL